MKQLAKLAIIASFANCLNEEGISNWKHVYLFDYNGVGIAEGGDY